MYFVKTPAFVRPFYSNLWWKIPTEEREVYLTFDDGPQEGITDKVLDMLSGYDAKATFFCVGEQVDRNKLLYQRLLSEGHAVGNHTWQHLSGRGVDDSTYLQDVDACRNVVDSKLFRPPYGKIRKSQVKQLKKDYHIIMWDILSGDFDEKCSPDQCAKNVLENVSPGSIVVFHDSQKAAERVLFALPQVLKELAGSGYRFVPLLPAKLVQ